MPKGTGSLLRAAAVTSVLAVSASSSLAFDLSRWSSDPQLERADGATQVVTQEMEPLQATGDASSVTTPSVKPTRNTESFTTSVGRRLERIRLKLGLFSLFS